MIGDFERNASGASVTVGAWARSVTLLAFLAACSSVPDAVNPVEWYKGTRDFITGKDEPETASTTTSPAKDTKPVPTAENRKGTPKGLVADSGNAQYAEPIRREVTPTRPLARKAPAADQQVAAAAPAPAAAAAVHSSPLPPAQTQTAAASTRADQGPDGPVAMNMTPPPPADVPETVPVPGRPKRLQQHFEQRLAESAQQVVRPGMVDMPQMARASYGEEAPIHLVPPGSNKKARSAGGGKGMAAPAPEPMPAASFQVASVQFAGGAKLDRSDLSAIAEVARLYKQTKGVVRVIGYAPTPGFSRYDPVSQVMGGLEASQARAEAVARELNRRGVPASKIMVAADPGYAGSGGTEGAQVFLDVM
ncbi:OmpA family protein [Magnetospirillum sp. 64-120]|uniref:OmpA family protein n=1 Tax=Magnetospirillum sp. 64-120 TaxID=1895778 RepID=UPI00092C8D34|nr:OmpA family protein [Magnetospirillum sp. 64-120]OJX65805.1 MAG: hypothetical protein BGO92_06825 [Magnetospirillum sp. 64-120]